MDEKEIIKLIKEKLLKRQESSIEITCLQDGNLIMPPKKQLFLDYQKVELNQIPIKLLKDLYNFADNSWVEWILIGISYQTEFKINLNKFNLPFVPWIMLAEWPLAFYLFGNPIKAFSQKTLTRSMIVTLPEESYLIKLPNQKLTNEAMDIVKKNKIQLIERYSKSCIWGK